MIGYGDPEYWENRYDNSKGKTFDWLEDFENLIELFKKFLKFEDKILVLGCGNSELSEKMYDYGYKKLVNIDICENIIKEMEERTADKKEMKWITMDCLNLTFEDEEFDFVVDKSTLDAILCGNLSFYNASKMMFEVQRVMKKQGIYCCISYGVPEMRISHFQRCHLDFELSCFIISSNIYKNDNDNEFNSDHYCYICKKRNLINKNKLRENFEKIKEQLLKEEYDELKDIKKYNKLELGDKEDKENKEDKEDKDEDEKGIEEDDGDDEDIEEIEEIKNKVYKEKNNFDY